MNAAWALVAGILAITTIGIPFVWLITVVLGIWLLYRVIRGWLALQGKKPMPLPD